MGDKALIEGDKLVMGDPPVPPLGKTLIIVAVVVMSQQRSETS